MASPWLATLAALAAPGCERAAASRATGPLAAEEGEAQFGRVFEGSLLEHDWTLHVTAPVAVASVKTDCGCTQPKLERLGPAGRQPYVLGTELAPGDELVAHVTYDTRGKRGPTRRAVTLELGGDAVFALVLTAEVQPWLLLEPAELGFQRLTEGKSAQREFRVRSASGEPFGLRATRLALPPWVSVELEPEGAVEGRSAAWKGKVSLGTEAPRGTFSYPIELATDVAVPGPVSASGPRTYSISPAWGLQVVGPVALSTPTLEFGLVRGDETVSKSLRLESFEPGFSVAKAKARLVPLHEGEPFALARTAQVHVRAGDDASEVELTLAGLAPEIRGTFVGLLVVETGHPRLPELQALVRGVRAPEGDGR